ncbi:DUF6870 family protein [Paenibacillus elgii]|uniref:DUF6870 family protein n=1 Tax=Paenibacillus elgii TaxID=189691 RepID=UPI000248D86C|nr:hypothetical protein [Paenibacillus elgii]
MTLKPERITALRNVNISTVDKSRLTDMSQMKLDNSLSKEKRLNWNLPTMALPCKM